jgi:plasmid maintenance system killer protein
MTIRLKLERRFLKSFAALSPDLKRRAEAALVRLQQQPDAPGLNLEKLRGFTDYYTIRVNRNFRILLRHERDEHGELFAVADIGPHDAIYRL